MEGHKGKRNTESLKSWINLDLLNYKKSYLFFSVLNLSSLHVFKEIKPNVSTK